MIKHTVTIMRRDLTTEQFELTPPSPVPFSDFCQSNQQGLDEATFASTNYKTNVSVGIKSQKLQTVKWFIDPGAGSNIVVKSPLH